jgi:uncharacterized protein YyaL (SSP411 family)
MAPTHTHTHTNRLAAEKSPYLLQHAHNPVDWYPWGEEAFARARAEDRPIFLSIGYSTCHWCHVMERESFEREEIAALMNRLFVNVKVDREERPDVDRVYMSFVQATTGGGGWPMSVWLTPELKPFYGGTYFPPKDAYGRPGFTTVLEAIDRTWREKRADVLKSSEQVVERLRELGASRRAGGGEGAPAALEAQTLADGAAVFARVFDPAEGGFGKAPKFPRPATHAFLLREWARSGDPAILEMVTLTLRKMAQGGMYDHLGGGFHRYSVDRFWHVPHFEKMLYDQAQLVDAYVEAYQATGDAAHLRIVGETCAYVLRDLTDPATGGFWSAEDADSLIAPGSSERLEGAFYVFTQQEIEDVVGADADAFVRAYAIEPDGNADDPHGELTGKNVLHRQAEEPESEALSRARAALLAYRNQRPRPHLDDKVLCSWNGMMIGALARASVVAKQPTWLAAAVRATEFVLATLWDAPTRTLKRRFRAGEAAFEAHLDDHAALANALASLYEATFDPRWLEAAVPIVEAMNERFADAEQGGWFATSGRDPSVLLRLKDDYDGAEPSGNSLAALACLRLGELCGRADWTTRAEGCVAAFSGRLREEPHAAPLLLTAFDWLLAGPTHIVLAGAAEESNGALASSMVEQIASRFVPRRVLARAEHIPWAREMRAVAGMATTYVCRDRSCDRPANDVKALEASLSRLVPAR